MSIPLTNEQLEIRDAVREQISALFDDQLKLKIASSSSFPTSRWSEFNAIGVRDSFSYLPGQLPEWGEQELAIIAQESGRALLSEPIISDGLFFGFIKPELTLESTSQLDSLKPVVVQFSAADRIKRQTDNIQVSSVVAVREDYNLAIIQVGLEPKLYLISANSFSIESQYKTLDLLTTESDIKCNLSDLIEVKLTKQHVDRFVALHELVLAAELTGITDRVLELTLEYVKLRKQFGVEIASFQSVQHRLADMYVFYESLSALTRFTAYSAKSSPEQFCFSANAASTYALKQTSQIVEAAIQLFGGVGFTFEHVLHLYLRRAQLLNIREVSIAKNLIDLARNIGG
jgi:hypothetical protein